MKKIFLLLLISLNTFSQIGNVNGRPPYASKTIEGYNVLDYGLKGDGTTDDGAILNNLVDNVFASGSTVYFPPTTSGYKFTTSVTISDKYFHFTSNQATLTIGTSNIQMFNISSTNATNGLASRCTFESLVFTATTTGGGQVGIYFSGNAGLWTVENCTFNGFSNAGVETLNSQTASTTNPSSLGGTIIGCKFYRNYSGVYNYTSGEYVQVIGCAMISNTFGIQSIGGNENIQGNTISYNVIGIDIGNGTNSGKCVIQGNEITHNSSVSINAHEIPSTQGLSITNNNIIYGTLRFANVTGIRVSGGMINADAYTFSTTVGCIFQDVLFSNSLANTISTTGNTPLYINCFKLNGDYATDGDNFTTVMPFKQSLCGSATLDFGSTVAGASTDLTITVTGAVAGDPFIVGVPAASDVAGGTWSAKCLSANTVTVRYANNSLVTTYDPASGVFQVIGFRQ